MTDPSTGDDEAVTLCESGPNTGIFTNRGGICSVDITNPSPAPSPATAWLTGLRSSLTTAIATGPDIGTYTVASVDSETQITLTTTLSTSRTNISFNAMPLMTATNDGSITLDDDLLEADHNDTLTVSYADCDDGDADSTNDIKIDTAVYNASSLLINEVLFYPDTAPTSCQTELARAGREHLHEGNVYWLQMRRGIPMKNLRTSRKKLSGEPGLFFRHTLQPKRKSSQRRWWRPTRSRISGTGAIS